MVGMAGAFQSREGEVSDHAASGVHGREREATVRANGELCGAYDATASSLGELALTEADLQRLRP